MNDLRNWFKAASRKQERVVLVDDAIFDGKFLRYYFYRLRYFYLRTAVQIALHVIGFLFLAFIFNETALAVAIIFRTICSFAHDFWWGALETMRQQIRSYYKRGDRHSIRDVLKRWMLISSALAFAVLVTTAVWIVLDLAATAWRIDPLHIFIFATALHLSLGILTKAYHSSVYAIRRIYRPFAAILGIQFAGFALTILFWPILGIWSYPASLVPVAILSSGLTFHYVRRARRSLGLRLRGRAVRVSPGNRGAGYEPATTFLRGLAYSLSRFDDLLILLVSYLIYLQEGASFLFLLLFIWRPFFRACHDWSLLFYFDFSRLSSRSLEKLRQQFESRLNVFSLYSGLVLGVLAFLLAWLLLADTLQPGPLPVLLVFVGRSLLALQQIKLFVARRYGILIVSGMLTIAACFFAGSITADPASIGLAAGLVFAVSALLLPHIAGGTNPLDDEFPALVDWLRRLKDTVDPVRVCRLDLANCTGQAAVRHVAVSIDALLGTGGAVSISGRHGIVWFERSLALKKPADREIAEISAGLACAVNRTDYCADGAAALGLARSQGLLGEAPDWREGANNPHLDTEPAKTLFLQMFPEGRVFDARKGYLGDKGQSTGDRNRAILRGALAYIHSMTFYERKNDRDITALVRAGSIRLIFITPCSASIKKKMAWRDYIDSVNISHACSLSAGL